MARGVNKAIIIGNLGNDPEVRYTTSGAAVVNISVATSEAWNDRQSGERQERTEWHRVVLFGRMAEIAGEYLRKGRQVYIEGRLQTRKWQSQDGQDRYTTEIVANDMQMLGGPGSGGSAPYDTGPPAGGGGGGAPRGQDSGQSSGLGAPADDDLDDDIPF